MSGSGQVTNDAKRPRVEILDSTVLDETWDINMLLGRSEPRATTTVVPTQVMTSFDELDELMQHQPPQQQQQQMPQQQQQPQHFEEVSAARGLPVLRRMAMEITAKPSVKPKVRSLSIRKPAVPRVGTNSASSSRAGKDMQSLRRMTNTESIEIVDSEVEDSPDNIDKIATDAKRRLNSLKDSNSELCRKLRQEFEVAEQELAALERVRLRRDHLQEQLRAAEIASRRINDMLKKF